MPKEKNEKQYCIKIFVIIFEYLSLPLTRPVSSLDQAIRESDQLFFLVDVMDELNKEQAKGPNDQVQSYKEDFETEAISVPTDLKNAANSKACGSPEKTMPSSGGLASGFDIVQ